MNALELIGPLNVELAKRVDPSEISEGELLIDVEACGICGTDIRIFRHGSPRVTFPRVLGHEIVGTVRRAPDRLQELIGRRVVLAPPAIPCKQCAQCRKGLLNLCQHRSAFGYELDGGFAEHVVVPAELASLIDPVPVPETLQSWVATLAEPVACCLNGHERLGPTEAGWVVILGAGFIGRVHNNLCKMDGALTVVVDPEPSRLVGVDADATVQGGGEEVLEQLRSIVGEDLSAIVVANSSPDSIDLAMALATERTRVLLFAGCGDATKGWRTNLVHYKELSLIGSFAALPNHVVRALELLNGPLSTLSGDVERVKLDDVPGFLDGSRQPIEPKVVVELVRS